ncbi:MAG: hypothetical protein AAGB06_01955, partial [Verrucomicrobiota bacterium]
NHHDKPAVEAAYLKAIENLSILRLPAIYGWPDVSRIKPYVNAVFQGNGTCRLHPTHAAWTHSRASVADCVQAIVLSLGLPGQQIFNVGEQTTLTEAEWCERVWNAAGKQGTLIEDPATPIPFNADLNQDWIADSSKIRKELGYRESSNHFEVLQTTIKAMLGWREGEALPEAQH